MGTVVIIIFQFVIWYIPHKLFIFKLIPKSDAVSLKILAVSSSTSVHVKDFMHYITSSTVSLSNITDNYNIEYDLRSIAAIYPFRVSPSYAGLIRCQADAIWKQCIPDSQELADDEQLADPLSESSLSPVPGLIHRYPDRVVLLVSNRCPVYCRFC